MNSPGSTGPFKIRPAKFGVGNAKANHLRTTWLSAGRRARPGGGYGHGPAAEHPIVLGHVYVNGNSAGSNTVAAFDRHADGSLTPIPGSPFPIGGAGLGAGLGSQGAIQVSPSGRFLLAVDAGSNQISVLRLNHRGILEQVGQPVASGGVQPVSIALNRTGLV